MKLLWVSLFCLLSFTACAKHESANEPKRETYEGDVRAKSLEVYSEKHKRLFYSCDNRWKETAIEISSAVEANRANIEARLKERNQRSSSIKTFLIGPIEFLERPPRGPGKDEWRSDVEGWALAKEIYGEIKAVPTHPDWLYLNSVVRSLILEDENRIVHAWHPGMRRTEGERAQRLAKTFVTCKADATCTSVNLAPDDSAWLREDLYDAYLLGFLTAFDSSTNDKREAVERLAEHLEVLADRYAFHPNPTFTVEGNTLIVPLHLEVFGAGIPQAIDLLEKTWGVHGLNLRIRAASPGENAYTIKVSPTPGQRAFVSWRESLLQLYTPVPSTTFRHEFGHVLGLDDAYYTHYDQSQCAYVYESNPGDIMSESATGLVLPMHIQRIKAAYRLQ